MKNTAAIQVVNHTVHHQYEVLQDAVKKETGVRCSILVKPHLVSVRTKDYADFILAKGIISKRVSVPVVRDEEGEHGK